MKTQTKKNNKFPGFPPKPSMNFWSYPKDLNGYWHQLSGSEQKALDYILRRTWGFDKVADEISLSQLQRGIKNLDKGTGLSRPTIIKALKGLIKKGFITKGPGKKANYYGLVKNFNYPSKESLPFAGKKPLHTIDNITINSRTIRNFSHKEKMRAYEQGKRWGEKPFLWNNPMAWKKTENKWYVVENEKDWKEFGGQAEDIEWRNPF